MIIGGQRRFTVQEARRAYSRDAQCGLLLGGAGVKLLFFFFAAYRVVLMGPSYLGQSVVGCRGTAVYLSALHRHG